MRQSSLIIAFLLCYCIFGQADETPIEVKREQSLEKFGDYTQFIPTAFSIALIIKNDDEEGFWQLAKSVSANLTATWVLKYAINKPRPEGVTEGLAFPSGHTSFAFQGAAFLQRRYGWKYGIPAYILAGLVGYSRIEGLNDRHDGWDVLAGAIVGIGSTYLFTTPYLRKHFDISFQSGGGSYALGIVYKF